MASPFRAARWRTVDIVVTAIIGVVCGVVFWLWAGVVAAFSSILGATPAASATIGLWMLAGVVAALVVRRPGAALFAEFIGGMVESIIGDQYGLSNVYYALLQGVGAELAFLLLAYKFWGKFPALAAGALAAVGGACLDVATLYPTLSVGWWLGYIAVAAVSGAVLAGALGFALVRQLARTGVLAPFPSGKLARLR